jgi:hypothetical protein
MEAIGDARNWKKKQLETKANGNEGQDVDA